MQKWISKEIYKGKYKLCKFNVNFGRRDQVLSPISKIF